MDLSNYPFKTQPRKHQRTWLESKAELEAHAIHWEMGTGKTKLAIDNVGLLWLDGKIDGVLILAPNGIDLNWLIDEIPKHLPESIREQSRIFRFSTKKSGSKAHKEQVKWNREHTGLAWLIMSYDAIMTIEGKIAALTFLEKRNAFYILDESTRIKTPGAKRTMRIVRTSWRAKYKRTLTGTPTPKGAFDIYSQIEFLQKDFWEKRGWESAAMFREYFGVYEKAFGRGSEEYDKLIGFQHLEELNELVASISSRVLKREVLDLPPKIYQSRWFELSSNQRDMYNKLREEYRLWLDQETLVTANLAMVRLLRLQQISCGYLPVGEGEPIHMIEGKNPRLELLEELLEDRNEKTIIWSRYRLDIDLITDMLRQSKFGNRFVIYDGRSSDEDMIRAKQEFQNGGAQFFVSNPAKGGEGLTLTAAENVIYYTNSFNLNHRLQSEDRAHRDGLVHPVTYTDLLGVDTVDLRIVKNLCGKMDVSDQVLGDVLGNDLRTNLKNWLDHDN